MDDSRSGPAAYRAHDTSLEQKTAVLPPAPTRERARPPEKDSRLSGFLIVALGVVLLVLATGDALAGTVFGDGGGALRGSGGGERLVGLDREDRILGFAGDAAATLDPGDRVTRSCETLYPG